jgi:hypothetical protein
MTDRMIDLEVAFDTFQHGSGDMEADFYHLQESYAAFLDAVDGFNVSLSDVSRIVTTVKQLRKSRPK